MSDPTVLRLRPELADYLGVLLVAADGKDSLINELSNALDAARHAPPEVERIPLPKALRDALEYIAKLGIYGDNAAEVAIYVTRRGLDDLFRSGTLGVIRLPR
jgi:hypothetical protein